MRKRDRPTPAPGSSPATVRPTGSRSASHKSAQSLPPASVWPPACGSGASTNAAAPDPGNDQPGLDREVQAHIGQQLRAAYREILNQPVPDRFVRLLEELAAQESRRR